MCGIAGLFAYNGAAPAPRPAELQAISEHMKRRGPDGAGEWWSADCRLGFAHRRLAIIDPVERAAQPMHSACGRYTIVFNGEIYNFRSLRNGLQSRGRPLVTQSDTETILELFALDGVDALAKLRGMFALAIHDARDNCLWLARDPYGIKPLYAANDGWTFRFASQVKSLLAGGIVSRDPEPAGAVGFFLFGHVPEPFTLYREIRSVEPGTFVKVDATGVHPAKTFASVTRVFAEAVAPSSGEFGLGLRTALLDSVSHHLVADVEVGAFLSAGVDSGAIVGLMRDCGQSRIRTVTLRYAEYEGSTEDEAPLASLVAKRYGTDHCERRVTRAEFVGDLPAILDAMDQPSIDGINSWFAAKAMRELGIKVALSGLGGDELLAGYPSFTDIPRWVGRFGLAARIPGLGALSRNLGALFLPGLAERNPKALAMLEHAGNYAGAYLLRRGLFMPHELGAVLPGDIAREGLDRLDPLARLGASLDPMPATPMARVAALESCNYMRSQLLRDADWAGMAQSVEIRVPLADFTLLQNVAPWIGQLQPGDGKRSLAACPSLPLPAEVVNRRKTGFGIPVINWLDGDASSSKGQASRHWSRRVFAAGLARAA